MVAVGFNLRRLATKTSHVFLPDLKRSGYQTYAALRHIEPRFARGQWSLWILTYDETRDSLYLALRGFNGSRGFQPTADDS